MRPSTVSGLLRRRRIRIAVLAVVSLAASQCNVVEPGASDPDLRYQSEENLPPGTVTDLSVAAATDSSVTISFTEVSDGTGQPASYVAVYHTPPMVWDSATITRSGSCAYPIAGSAIGTKRTCTVGGLPANTSEDFQIVAYRGTPDVDAVFGALSNVVDTATLASPATVEITPASGTIAAGQSIALTAVVKDSSGNVLTGVPAAWSSANPAVATIDSSGLAAGVAAGNAIITATVEGKSGQAQLTIAADSGGGYVTPDLLNNISFEGGWDGMTSSGFTPPSNVTRDPAHAVDGSLAVLRQLPTTTADVGGGMSFPFYAGSPLGQWNPTPAVPAQTHDRMWARFYFYFDGVPNTPFKFQLWWGAGFSEQFGGWYVDEGGRLGFLFIEWLYRAGGTIYPVVDLHSLERGWHSIEVDYWRNGDPSGYPSAAFWLDNNQLRAGIGSPGGGGYWDANGRLNAGSRYTSSPLGAYNMLGILNKNNTSPGSVWIDRVSLSSLGRIGP